LHLTTPQKEAAMKPAIAPATPAPEDAASTPYMGSEYMDARSYLTHPTRPPRVRTSDKTFHGSNESDFGSELLQSE
jgi:hypothetical protein